MTPAEVNDIANYIVLFAVIPFGLFTLSYGILAPWYKSLLGITMFSLGFSTTAVLGVVLLRRWFGEYPGYEWVAIIVYSLLTLTAISLVAIFFFERHRGRGLRIETNRKKDTDGSHSR